jgi:tight adherence protein B
MNPFADLARPAAYGVLGCGLALFFVVYVLLAPKPERLPIERRRPYASSRVSPLTTATRVLTEIVDRVLQRSHSEIHDAVLERAGVTMKLQDLVVLIGAGSLVAAAAGVVLSGPLAGVLLFVAVPIVVRMTLEVMAGRRRQAFADQLDDSLQLMASSLRAGHSLLQALASVAREAEAPTSIEFARIINETRVGLQLSAALDETARRMRSEDFNWVTQAIAINREVGGNLAEVLDGVGETIRERNQIRRQVETLSSEGKLSAYVLMALPLGIGGFLSFSNPEYMLKFTQSLTGYGLILLSVVLLVIGGIWLRKIVKFTF